LAEAEVSSKGLHCSGAAIKIVELSRPQQAISSIENIRGQDRQHSTAVKGLPRLADPYAVLSSVWTAAPERLSRRISKTKSRTPLRELLLISLSVTLEARKQGHRPFLRQAIGCEITMGKKKTLLNTTELDTEEKRSSFDLYRSTLTNIDVITFDELFRKMEHLARIFNLVKTETSRGS
jgi:hypothetical protein